MITDKEKGYKINGSNLTLYFNEVNEANIKYQITDQYNVSYLYTRDFELYRWSDKLFRWVLIMDPDTVLNLARKNRINYSSVATTGESIFQIMGNIDFVITKLLKL